MLPKTRKFLTYPASLSKIGLSAKTVEFCLMYNASVKKFLLFADMFEFLGLHWIANKILDIFPKSQNFLNYIASLPKFRFSCQNLGICRIIMLHCWNLDHCITASILNVLSIHFNLLNYIASMIKFWIFLPET